MTYTTELEFSKGTISKLEAEKFDLQQTIFGMETKNAKLFAALEKALADKARDYKERTEDILGTSPRAGERDCVPRMSRSPLIDRYVTKSRGSNVVT